MLKEITANLSEKYYLKDEEKRKYKSSIDRLSSLPEIFHGQDLFLDTNLDRSLISLYLNRWKKSGLIKGLGGKTDVFFNAACYKTSGNSWVERAIIEFNPSSIETGICPLHRAEWTTQIPQRIEVAIPRVNAFKSDYAVFYPRTSNWFSAIRPGLNINLNEESIIPSLRPAWALADLWLCSNEEAWKPDPDDLDMSIISENKESVNDFIDALKKLSHVYRVSLEIPDTKNFPKIYCSIREQILERMIERKPVPDSYSMDWE